MHDISGHTAAWGQFKKSLSNLFMHYHAPQVVDGQWNLVQTFCCFDIISRSAIPDEGNEHSDDSSTSVKSSVSEYSDDTYIIENFTPQSVALCDKDGWTQESENDYLQREFDFFLPVIIWE